MKRFLIVLGLIFFYYFLVFLICSFYYRKTIGQPEKSTLRRVKKPNIIMRLIWDFPRQFAYDRTTRNPNIFEDYGLHMVCGKQGSGKTVTVAYLLRQYQQRYPLIKVKTNFNYKAQNSAITHWKDLTMNTNGIYGEVDCIDEIQNWFSSNSSLNFPEGMLSVVTQQRKVRRCILGTAQVFTRISKPLREQTYLLYLPITLLGCMTIVRVYDLDLDMDANIDRKKIRKLFMFVHDKALRESFDSYEVVAKMVEVGFKEDSSTVEVSASRAGIPSGSRTERRRQRNSRI